MTRPRSLRVHGIYAVLGVLALSCARAPGELVVGETTPDEQIMPEQVIPSGEDAERTKDGLVRVRAPTIDALIYVKPPRPHLQRYDRMYVNMPQIR